MAPRESIQVNFLACFFCQLLRRISHLIHLSNELGQEMTRSPVTTWRRQQHHLFQRGLSLLPASFNVFYLHSFWFLFSSFSPPSHLISLIHEVPFFYIVFACSKNKSDVLMQLLLWWAWMCRVIKWSSLFFSLSFSSSPLASHAWNIHTNTSYTHY